MHRNTDEATTWIVRPHHMKQTIAVDDPTVCQSVCHTKMAEQINVLFRVVETREKNTLLNGVSIPNLLWPLVTTAVTHSDQQSQLTTKHLYVLRQQRLCVYLKLRSSENLMQALMYSFTSL